MSLYPNEAARKANERLYQERQAYQSTTEPLTRINNTLQEIKDILKDLLELQKGSHGKPE